MNSPVFLLYLPGLDGEPLRSETPSPRMPVLNRIAREGSWAIFPGAGPLQLVDGILTSGQEPPLSGVLDSLTPRPDGYGSAPATAMDRQGPAVWDYLDAASLKCAIVNMRGTSFSTLRHGTVVSDQFCAIHAPRVDGWGIPPGAVFPPESGISLGQLRIYPQDLQREDLADFFDGRIPDREREAELRLVVRTLCENVNAHAAATQLLEKEAPDFLAVSYPAFEQMGRMFPDASIAKENRAFVSGFARLLDGFIARLIDLGGHQATLFILGGTPQKTFWLIHGPLARKMKTFHAPGGLLDVAPSLLSAFSIHTPAAMPGSLPTSVLTTSQQTTPPALDPVTTPNPALPTSERVLAAIPPELLPPRWSPGRLQRQMAERARFRRHYLLAEFARHKGDRTQAIEEYRNALQVLPGDTRAKLQLCQCLLESGQAQKAQTVLSEMSEKDLHALPVRLLSADTAIASGELERAASMLNALRPEEFVNEELRNAFCRLWNKLADSYLGRRHYTQSLSCKARIQTLRETWPEIQ